jgi:tetratricopeptide (TPR) repeat protein
MTSKQISGIAFAFGVVAACSQAQPPQPSQPGPLAQARALALQRPASGLAADGYVLEQQRKLDQLPKKHDLWILLGQAWIRMARETADPGYYLNADACADVALALEPGSSLANDLHAIVLMNGHRFSEAKQLAEKMLSQNKDDLLALGTLSDAELELGHIEASEAAAQHMLDVKPSLPSYSRASYLRWLLGDVEGAKSAIKSAFNAGRDQRDHEPASWALVQAATYFWQAGDYQGADAGMDLALQYFPGFAAALVGKGRVLLSLDRAKDAIPYLEKALAAAPQPTTAWLLGDARAATGDQKGAEEAYLAVEQLGRQTDRRTLALFYAVQDKNLEEAEKLIDEERKTRGDIYTEDAWAFVLYRRGRFAEARTAIDHALRLGTQDAQLLFHGGAIHLAAGDTPGGRKLLEEALRLSPKFDLSGSAEAAKLLRR